MQRVWAPRSVQGKIPESYSVRSSLIVITHVSLANGKRDSYYYTNYSCLSGVTRLKLNQICRGWPNSS